MAGRPSTYDERYPEEAYGLCLLGYTDKDLGKYFGVSEPTINAWKRKHPDFCKALKDGKEIADANVAKSLYKRATGYTYKEVRFEKVVLKDEMGADIETEMFKKSVTHKEVAPDVPAIKMWLYNRQKDRWKDQITHEQKEENDRPILEGGRELPKDE